MTIAYVNGNYLPLEQASLPVMDRGFLFGDAVYEVIPVYNNRPFRESQHLSRFEKSLNAVYIDIDISIFHEIIHNLIGRNAFYAEQAVYLQVTRGTSVFRDQSIPLNIKPNIFAFCMQFTAADTKKLSQEGVSIITLEDIRWSRCDIKSIDLLPNILQRKTADEFGAFEAIMVRDGMALEGTATNFFMVQEGALYTPPLSKNLLGGVTRELVLELAVKHGIDAYECDIPENDLFCADEIWLTSSTKEIVPVIKVNGKLISNGQVGPVYRTMLEYYLSYKNELMSVE